MKEAVSLKKVNWLVVLSGAVVGLAAVVLTLLGNLLSDILYAVADPRVRLGG